MASGSPSARLVSVQTPHGEARAHVRRPVRAVGTLVLGHGAGGGIEAADLVAVSDAVVAAGWAVALVEQPWRVAGGRIAPAPPRLDAAWLPVVRALRSGRAALPGRLVLGGRSAGARVACRTATELEAAAVVALAFPLHAPGRTEPTRSAELALATGGRTRRPVLVVQGRRDAFGDADELRSAAPRGVHVVAVDGGHSLKIAPDAVADVVVGFLGRLPSEPVPADAARTE
jgi:uncharacterized protein